MIQPNLGACPGGIRRTPRPTRTFTAATKMEAGGRLRGLPRPRRGRQRAARVLKKRRCAFSGKSRQRRDRLRRRRLRNRETSRARGGCSARFLERTRQWETCRRCLACLRAACPRPAPTSSGPPPTPRVLGRLSSGVSPSVTTRGRSGGGICQRPRPRRARQARRGREREGRADGHSHPKWDRREDSAQSQDSYKSARASSGKAGSSDEASSAAGVSLYPDPVHA